MAGYLTILETLANTHKEDFLADKTKSGAAESYLRRTLEAIFDIGRHILAKTGNLNIATEYKGIARGLKQQGVVGKKLGDQLAIATVWFIFIMKLPMKNFILY
jgi:uncharacterized protein YutE (UPF0331/DUF86 family)